MSESTSQPTGGCARNIGRLAVWLLLAMVGYYLLGNHPVLFVVFGIIVVLRAIGWIMGKFPALKGITGIAIVCIMCYFAYRMFEEAEVMQQPVMNRPGRITIHPPERTGNGDWLADLDYLSEKEVEWYDFSDASYMARYKTSGMSFEESLQSQKKLKVRLADAPDYIDFFTRFYMGLSDIDEQKIKAVAQVFRDSAIRKDMDLVEATEMVTTFIQEIPYYLVHEGTCKEAVETGQEMMVTYHRDKRPCLPQVDAGIQSPYSFLHNLKGDCDTRSLLAHCILREMNIASSVWVSETYGHSILGVALPAGHGMYKTIEGVKHYGIELTAKGFRIGMVAPEHARPENWEVTTYTKH